MNSDLPGGYGGLPLGFSFVEQDRPEPVRLLQLVEESGSTGECDTTEAWCIAGALCATSVFVFLCL